MQKIRTILMREVYDPRNRDWWRWLLAFSPALILVALLAACSQPVVQVQPDQSAICDALKPAMPIQFHSKSDTPDTVARIQQANARYQAACK